jgi:hypothetical protein
MDRMFLAARGPRLMRIGPRAHPRLVRALPGAPPGLGENFDGFSCNHHEQRENTFTRSNQQPAVADAANAKSQNSQPQKNLK